MKKYFILIIWMINKDLGYWVYCKLWKIGIRINIYE